MIRVIRICRKCGAKIFSDAPEGLCAKCVLKTALIISSDAPVAAGDDGGTDGKVEVNVAAAHDSKKASRLVEMLGELGDYELLEEVGRGGQGVVFRARQKSLNRTVALKVISLGHWASKAHLKRFRREAEAAANLDHPNIVPIYEVGERDSSCYFSMRFVEGGQLDEVVRRTPMSIRKAAELIAKVAWTVHYAHEQARGQNEQITPATDVYGLGAGFYQLLTGHPPFAGGTSYQTIQLLLDTEPRPPRLLNPKIDRELSTICLKCLEKDPKRRYASALALAEDLEHWLRHEPIHAKRSGFFTHARKWVRRNPTSALLAASLIALAAAMGWNVWKSELVSGPATSGIAVLPFENLSHDPDNAYFAEGIQEEILTRLASIASLKVISGTSTQQYQSKTRNLSEIAKQLGVANILEGSVQKAADQVRVNVQLVNAQTDSHLWADTYDRKLTDIFGVESEIAKRIAESLQAKLTGREKQALAAKPTNNPEAYDAYLRGAAFEVRGNSSMGPLLNLISKAAGFYERAVELDPKFAIAWARLSRADALLYFNPYHDDTASTRGEAAKRALENAQKLEPNSPETLLALGYYQYWVLRDYAAAKTAFERVSKMLPGSSEVLMALARIAGREGNWDQRIAYDEQALALDPRNVELLIDAGG